MGVAAGIAILAALTHGLVGFSRRPPDRAGIAFAIAAAAAAAGALSVLALYTIHDIDLHIAVMKWAYFPATVVWTAGRRLVRRLRRRRAADAVPARADGRLRLHAGRQRRPAPRDPPRAEGRAHGDGRHGRLRHGHDAVVAAHPPERDRRAHAHLLRVPVLRGLSRVPPPRADARPLPGAHDRAPRRRDAVRRGHRAPGRHHLQHAVPLAGQLRGGHHRREPRPAARVAPGGDGAAAVPHAHGRARRGPRPRARRGPRASGRGVAGAARHRGGAAPQGRGARRPHAHGADPRAGARRSARRSTRRRAPPPASSRPATCACGC